MKVLQINQVYGFGSTGIIAKDINEMLINESISSYVACQSFSENSSNLYRIGTRLGQLQHSIFARITGKQGFHSNSPTTRLINHIKKISPDVIHLHNLHGNFVNVEVLLSFLAKEQINTVVTLHDCWFFTGKCYHFDLIGCSKWETECNHCPKLKDDVPSYLFDRTNELFHLKKKIFSKIENLKIVGVSNWISYQARKSFLNNRSISTINNGIDLTVFQERSPNKLLKSKFSNKFVIMGFANKWLDKKNYEALVKLTSKLDDRFSVIIIGSSRKNGFPPKVKFVEFIKNRHELAQYYSLADVFVNPTLEDSLPTVNMESIACGTPVITFNSGGSPELIKEGTGLVIERGSHAEIYESVSEIWKNGKDYYKKRCLAVSKTLFDKNLNYKKYLDIYKSF